MIKKFILPLICFLSMFLFSNKISAIDISFCDYGDDYVMPLPVTLKAEIATFNPLNPYSQSGVNTYELFVYNQETCEDAIIALDYPNSNYVMKFGFYYIYNNVETKIDKVLKNGTYISKDLSPPKITLAIDAVTINVGRFFSTDEFSFIVSAHDQIDADIIPEIVYDSYTENYPKPGSYNIVYKACDKSNNCSTATLPVNIVDKTPPVIEGISTIDSYISHPIKVYDIINELKAIDDCDGDISQMIEVSSTNYIHDVPGQYYAYFFVKDKSGNEIKNHYKVNINVIDDVAPTIEGPTNFISNLSSTIETKMILENMIVSDNADNKAYKNLYILSDNYTANKKNIGTYTVILSAYDNSGNESFPYIITIEVVDDIAPTIDGEKNYESYMSSPVSLLEIKANLIVFDNHDGNLFNKLEIIEDTYSNKKDNIGIYHIIFIVKDSSNNSSQPFDVQIIVYDNIAPIIEGINYYKTLNTEKLNINSIKLSLNASDNVDGDITETIELDEDGYSDNHSQLGTYFISFYACDKSGNISNIFKVKILVEENISFLRSIDNSYVYLDTKILKNDTEVLSILGVEKENYNNILAIENSYINNYNIDGEYKIKYEFENKDFTKNYITVNVKTYTTKVTQKEDNTTTIQSTILSNKKEKKETIFSKIASFIKNIFNKIKNFFKKLFR